MFLKEHTWLWISTIIRIWNGCL